MKEELPLARSLKAEWKGLRLSNCNPVSILNIPQETALSLIYLFISSSVLTVLIVKDSCQYPS